MAPGAGAGGVGVGDASPGARAGNWGLWLRPFFEATLFGAGWLKRTQKRAARRRPLTLEGNSRFQDKPCLGNTFLYPASVRDHRFAENVLQRFGCYSQSCCAVFWGRGFASVLVAGSLRS